MGHRAGRKRAQKGYLIEKMRSRGPLAAIACQTAGRTSLYFECGGFRFTGGIGHFDDGRLAEVFLTSSKTGTAIDTAARDSAVVASVALQHGADVETLRRALMRNSEGMASGPLGALLDLLADGGP